MQMFVLGCCFNIICCCFFQLTISFLHLAQTVLSLLALGILPIMSLQVEKKVAVLPKRTADAADVTQQAVETAKRLKRQDTDELEWSCMAGKTRIDDWMPRCSKEVSDSGSDDDASMPQLVPVTNQNTKVSSSPGPSPGTVEFLQACPFVWFGPECATFSPVREAAPSDSRLADAMRRWSLETDCQDVD